MSFLLNPFKNPFQRIKPVYKIAITYPTDNQGHTYTKVIADTASTVHKFANGVSDVIGMWIDDADVQEPGKSVVLLRVDPTVSSAIFGQEYTVNEVEFLSYKSMTVRHWLDIWIDYDSDLSSNNLIGFGKSFKYFDDSHLFSGPIVSMTRTITDSGDRIMIIGLTADLLLKYVTSTLGYSNEHLFNFEVGPAEKDQTTDITRPTVKKVIEDILSLVGQFSDTYDTTFKLGRRTNPTLNGKKFYFGSFYYHMLNIPTLKSDLKTPGIPLNESSRKQFSKPAFYHASLNLDILERELSAPLNLQGDLSLWKLFQTALSVPISGSTGLRLRVSKEIPDKYNSAPDVKTGANKHPGLMLQLYAESEVEALDYVAQNGKSVWSNKIINDVTLGKDIIDMEMWTDYGSIFNVLRIKIAKFIVTNDAQNQLPEFKQEVVKFPLETGMFQNESLSENDMAFWQGLYDDIIIFGEQTYPALKLIFQRGGKKNEVSTQASYDDSVYAKTYASTEIKKMMRRYYYGGVEGTVFTVGDNALKVGRLIKIHDRNGIVNTNSILSKISSAITNRFHYNFASLADSLIRMPFGEVEPYHGKGQIDFVRFLNMNTEPLYIWKVRHYIGQNAGWVTKIYFTKTRGSTYTAKSRDVLAIVQETQKNMRMKGNTL